ncbi:MAG: esterase [Oxalobacter sp.]|nr:esterase [Oxalobacter sp.]
MPPSKPPRPAGRYRLALAESRDTLLVVPQGLQPDKPVPLLVMFHGAQENAANALPFLIDHANQHRFLLLLPQSTRVTWDICMGSYGQDLLRLGKAVNLVSSHFAIDPAHIALAGFSDGGSYALSLGLANGDRVSHIIVFSGGFIARHEKTNLPPVFLSHSPQDERLNIQATGNRLHQELKAMGAEVDFHTFSGGHIIHPGIVKKAMAFFME